MNCHWCQEEITNTPREAMGYNFHQPSVLRDCVNDFLKAAQQRRGQELALQAVQPGRKTPNFPGF